MANPDGLKTKLGPTDKIVLTKDGRPLVASDFVTRVFGDIVAKGAEDNGTSIRWTVNQKAQPVDWPQATAERARLEELCKRIKLAADSLGRSQWKRTGKFGLGEWERFRLYVADHPSTEPAGNQMNAEFADALHEVMDRGVRSIERCLEAGGSGQIVKDGQRSWLIGWGIEPATGQASGPAVAPVGLRGAVSASDRPPVAPRAAETPTLIAAAPPEPALLQPAVKPATLPPPVEPQLAPETDATSRSRRRLWPWILLAAALLALLLLALTRCEGGPYAVRPSTPRPLLAAEVLVRRAPEVVEPKPKPDEKKTDEKKTDEKKTDEKKTEDPKKQEQTPSGSSGLPGLTSRTTRSLPPADCSHQTDCNGNHFKFCPWCGIPLGSDGLPLHEHEGGGSGGGGSSGGRSGGGGSGGGSSGGGTGGGGSGGGGLGGGGSSGDGSGSGAGGSGGGEGGPGGSVTPIPDRTGDQESASPTPDGDHDGQAQQPQTSKGQPLGECDCTEIRFQLRDDDLSNDGFTQDSGARGRAMGISIRTEPTQVTHERHRQLAGQRVKPEDFRGYGLDPYRRGTGTKPEDEWLDLRMEPPRFPAAAKPLGLDQAGGVSGAKLTTGRGLLEVEGALARLWIEPGVKPRADGGAPVEWMFYPTAGEPHQPKCWSLCEPVVEGGSCRLVCPPQAEALEGFVEFIDPTTARTVARTLPFRLERRP